jgi:quercetin dioxygenase-like cupin family protein
MTRFDSTSAREPDFVDEASELDPEAPELFRRLAEPLARIDPRDEVRARMLAAANEKGRLHRFAEPVARLLDVGEERARELIDGIDDPASWVGAPFPGVELYHIEGGATVANAITGFIRIDAGHGFPEHTHLGDEKVLILQGRLVDDGGRELGPGTELPMGPGTTHSFTVKPGPRLVYLAIVHGGLEVAGMTLRPGDPRI